MADTDDALQLVTEMAAFIQKNRGGYSDEAAIQHLRGLTRQINHLIPGVAHETGNVMNWAEILYSHRKYKKCGGPDRVYSLLYGDCYRLRTKIELVASARAMPSGHK
jgi:hypothetical protein